jgi:hypothetical protein
MWFWWNVKILTTSPILKRFLIEVTLKYYTCSKTVGKYYPTVLEYSRTFFETVGKYYPTFLECSVNKLTEFPKVTNNFQLDLFPIYSKLEFASTLLKV